MAFNLLRSASAERCKCGRIFTRSAYAIAKRDYRCGACKEDPAKHRARQAIYRKTPEAKARHRKLMRAIRLTEAGRLESRARNVCNKAIVAGKLQREPCARCGSATVHAHHTDYTRPLDVIWLCPLHHKEAHR